LGIFTHWKTFPHCGDWAGCLDGCWRNFKKTDILGLQHFPEFHLGGFWDRRWEKPKILLWGKGLTLGRAILGLPSQILTFFPPRLVTTRFGGVYPLVFGLYGNTLGPWGLGRFSGVPHGFWGSGENL